MAPPRKKQRRRRRAAPITEDGFPGVFTGEAHQRAQEAWRLVDETGDIEHLYTMGVYERPDEDDES